MQIQIADYLDSPLDSFADVLRNLETKRVLGSLTLGELASRTGAATGLYALFDGARTCLYVGKCSSRSFIGRLSAHCDQREDYDMNNFARALVRDSVAANIEEAMRSVVAAQVVTVAVPQELDGIFTADKRAVAIGQLERKLQHALGTKHNKKAGKLEEGGGTQRVRDILAA